MTIVWIVAAIFVASFLLVVFRGAPYVPTRSKDLERAFDDLYAIGGDDVLVDIGSGDGKVLRLASARGAKAIGYEINPFLVLISKWLSRRDQRVKVRFADFWRVDAPDDTTLVYTFGESRDIEKMALWTEMQATKIGKTLYFMSYAFSLKTRTALRKNGQFYLYEIHPLQPGED